MTAGPQETKGGNPHFIDINPDAKYGICGVHTDQWIGDWFYTRQEAQEAADRLERFPLPVAVLRIGGNWKGDADWLEPSLDAAERACDGTWTGA